MSFRSLGNFFLFVVIPWEFVSPFVRLVLWSLERRQELGSFLVAAVLAVCDHLLRLL